jgi:hypothetical protein
MKIRLSVKKGLAMFLMVLALATPVWAPLGMDVAARVARDAAAPRAVAVNWNSNAMSVSIME